MRSLSKIWRQTRLLIIIMGFAIGINLLAGGNLQLLPGSTTSQAALPPGLPSPQIHPLPPSLQAWQDPTQSGDYFDQIQPPAVGHLIWSHFPIRIYVEVKENNQAWRTSVIEAASEWQAYLPWIIVEQSDAADIQIFQRRPPLKQGQLRARSAETRYEFYAQPGADGSQILSHRFTIWLSPTQVGKYIYAAARHELGHAFGIWGHSPVETDVMYFSQVRVPPLVSARDINTLKRIYQQPTRLGWLFP